MAPRTIPQRELRNNIGEVLREAERGTEFTITVRGRPVARLGPPEVRRLRQVDVDLGTVRALLEATPIDNRFGSDLEQIRAGEEPVDEPWRDR
jgi:prevent-host-death family protein